MADVKWQTENGSLFRGIVTVARPHTHVLHPAQFNLDLPIASVTGFIAGIIAEAVLRADFRGHLGKGGAGLLQGGSLKISAAAASSQLVHLAPGEVIEL